MYIGVFVAGGIINSVILNEDLEYLKAFMVTNYTEDFDGGEDDLRIFDSNNNAVWSYDSDEE